MRTIEKANGRQAGSAAGSSTLTESLEQATGGVKSCAKQKTMRHIKGFFHTWKNKYMSLVMHKYQLNFPPLMDFSPIKVKKEEGNSHHVS